MRWDIFCSVVDNLGDIGVCWRLARQLAAEHRAVIRLWVDDLDSFRTLAPDIDVEASSQRLGAIEVCHWVRPFPQVEPADVVIESFGCDLPEDYVQAMAARSRAPVWVNLEYLSAESWVGGCHRLPSPHPRLPLTQYFFFPGFSAATGGVLIERGLAARRREFQGDPGGMQRFLAGFGVPPRTGDELLVSFFCYPRAPLSAMFDAWRATGRKVRVIGFRDTPGTQAIAEQGLAGGNPQGSVSAAILPFLSQDDYDRVLWACDWNFVRGEDSFVRAQLAGKPLVWQAYPQPEDAHRVKLDAFLTRYGEGEAGQGQELARLWQVWNGFEPAAAFGPAWAECVDHQTQLEALARDWASRLEDLGDLAGKLAQFCAERV